MKLDELIITEISLQGALKRFFKQAGTIKSVLGDDADNAAQLLRAKPDDTALVLKKGGALQQNVFKSVSGSRAMDDFDSEEHGKIKLTRLTGGARVLVVGDEFLLTTEQQYNDLVEAKLGIYSDKKKEQEQIDPKTVKKIQSKAGGTKNGKKPLER